MTTVLAADVFDALLQHYIERSNRYGDALWMLRWGVDGLATPGRQWGKRDATRFLNSVAERASACTRNSDILARLDNGDFALLLIEGNEYCATVIGDRIRRSVHHLPVPGTAAPSIGLSVGVSPRGVDERLGTWKNRVGRALHAARLNGGDSTIVLHPSKDRTSGGLNSDNLYRVSPYKTRRRSAFAALVDAGCGKHDDTPRPRR